MLSWKPMSIRVAEVIFDIHICTWPCIIFHGMMFKLMKLTSSIVFDPWCNLDAAGVKRDAHAGFF